jgi:RNA polymerase sigma-70 factor (ECF subfamily)
MGTHRYSASAEQSELLLRSFLAAARDGDVEQLVELLAADAVFYGDGGGKAVAVRQPLYGREKVANFLVGLSNQAKRPGVAVEAVLVNGGPGLITRDPEGKMASVLALEVADGVVQTLRSIVNPDKLAHLGPVFDLNRTRDGGVP